MGSRSFQKFPGAVDEQHKMWGDISRATGPLYAAYVVLLEFGVLLLAPLGGWFFVRGRITAGVLLLFAFVGNQYLTDIRPLQELSSDLSYVLNGMNQVQEILDTPIFTGGQPFPQKHDIEIRNVTFGYSGDTTVLEHCNLHITHGERVAFAGESGAGKSTLVQLISRFYDVGDGSVRIGGVDVREIDYEALLQNISVVFQQSFLTRGSVFENIAMGDHTATLEQVRAAAKEAQIDNFIMSLPGGYDTAVGGYGTRFSGGEKQRISIARAMLKNAPIIILDEATASIDSENEHLIQAALSKLTRGKTIITIAHRLATIEQAGQILAVDDGEIVQQGTHAELMEQPGRYRGFVETRRRAEGWNIS